jgi:hypothetical protein
MEVEVEVEEEARPHLHQRRVVGERSSPTLGRSGA